jgi:hypothetical protein
MKIKKFMFLIVIAILFLSITAFAPAQSNSPGFPDELKNALVTFAVALITLATSAVGYYGAYYFKKLAAKVQGEIGLTQYNWLTRFIYDMVVSVAQNPIAKEWTGEKLKKYVLITVMKKVVELKLPFDEADIDNLIEAAVKNFKESTGWKAEYSEPK